VSTSVIEVGVDMPNASVMCIEGAERFGLAQLHQFRGRVGRGEHPSWCFLLPGEGADGDQRLKAMTRIADGFTLAEKDLEMRGPGDVLGVAQSGRAPFSMVSFGDVDLISRAREAAKEILDEDPELERHPALRGAMRRAADEAHLE
jgi:ATP-dependent DNA helicase RecG